MAGYIKSHSNYRLQTRHQVVDNGVIFERDISTVGGVNSFATGQSTIYQSGNFVIVVNNSSSASRHVKKKEWLSSGDNNDMWTELTLENHSSDINGSVEKSIMLKNDFMDLRTFAYYGSLADLIQNTVYKIIETFPYEMYVANEVLKHVTISAPPANVTESGGVNYIDYDVEITPDTTILVDDTTFIRVFKNSQWIPIDDKMYTGHGDLETINLVTISASSTLRDIEYDILQPVSNPGNIDIYSQARPRNVLYSGSIYPTIIGDEEHQNPFTLTGFSGDGDLEFMGYTGYTPYAIIEYNTGTVANRNQDGTWKVKGGGTYALVFYGEESYYEYGAVVYESIIAPEDSLGYFHDGGYKNYCLFSGNTEYEITEWKVDARTEPDKCLEPGDWVATISISIGSGLDVQTVNLEAYVDNNRNIQYYGYPSDGVYSIRPNSTKWYYDNFIDNLDLFGKCLVGVYSGVRNTAKFEVLRESETGTVKNIRIFEFPSASGGYNIAVDGFALKNYIKELGRIGLTYDEAYTDNLYRMMTHDSLKNLDWTKGFNGEDEGSYQNQYTETGEKFSAIIRVIGYTFDNEKAYIDSIGNVNTVSYSNRANLSDYFLTDALETNGISVNTIYPYDLHEFNSSGADITDNQGIWTENNQLKNVYPRKFSENTSDIIKPYSEFEGGYYTKCIDGVFYDLPVPNYSGQTYYVDGEKVYTVHKKYYSDREFSIPDVNNEFMKRFKINSKYILRKKGTIDGIESLLGLFGLKSRRWVNEPRVYDRALLNISDTIEIGNDTYYYVNVTVPANKTLRLNSVDSAILVNESSNWTIYEHDYYKAGDSDEEIRLASLTCDSEYIYYSTEGEWYDFEISEKTYLAAPITDEWDSVHGMYRMDWYNSCKTIPYDTQSYINGEYIPYQGLPVAYRDVNLNDETSRKVYPYFDSKGIYDGDMYYQMNGGWLAYLPYAFDVDDNVLLNDEGKIRVETLRNIMQVKNMTELVNQPVEDLYDNIIYYVNDINEKLALINGYPYPLKEESTDGNVRYYFEVEIYSGSLSVGGYLFDGNIIVSNSSVSGTSEVNLSIYENGTTVRIYYTGDPENAFVIAENRDEGYSPYSSLIFINGEYDDEIGVTHYYILKDAMNSGLIGNGYWEGINTKSQLYKIVNNITDKAIGNNPHSGNFSYDRGNEYLDRFMKLFKYAEENRYFNESCFPSVDVAYEEIDGYGFVLSGCQDTKIHSFADTYDENGKLTEYDINSNETFSGISEYYSIVSGTTEYDGATSQIMNTKNVTLTFYLHAATGYSKDGQEEIKYIQSKIMPYLEQMIPSTLIVNVVLVPRYINSWKLFDDTFDCTTN